MRPFTLQSTFFLGADDEALKAGYTTTENLGPIKGYPYWDVEEAAPHASPTC